MGFTVHVIKNKKCGTASFLWGVITIQHFQMFPHVSKSSVFTRQESYEAKEQLKFKFISIAAWL